MSYYKVFFGHPNSAGVGVVASTEKEARIKAMNILRDNRGDTRWNAKQYVNWEERVGEIIYTLSPHLPTEEAPMILINKDGNTVYAGPPAAKHFGAFPPIVKVELIE